MSNAVELWLSRQRTAMSHLIKVCGLSVLLTSVSFGGKSIQEPIVNRSIRSERKINIAIEEALKRHNANTIENSEGYLYNLVDLNDDRNQDALVYVWGSSVCGSSGCGLFVLKNSGQRRYEVVSEMELVHVPIIVSGQRTSGWNDLVTRVYGGGVRPGYRIHRFDGHTYDGNSSDSSDLPRRIEGTAYMSDWGRPDAGVRRK